MTRRLLLSVSAIAILGAGVAHAQTAPTGDGSPHSAENAVAATGGETTAGEDIVVTAERRSTSLQRTGVAATVLTGQDLLRKSVSSVEQLQFATPSLTVNTSGQANSFNIRGIGKAEVSSSIGVGIITYRDGVATFPGYFQREPYYDIASVEVLRGPQGTFAGGNATGGAVFITEANPTFDGIHGYAQGQYGNYNDVKFEGAVNVPLSSTLAMRFATSDERRDTFFHITGPWTGNPGDLRSYSGRISLLWQPTSQLRVLIKGDYNNINVGGYPGSPAAATYDPFHVSANAPLSGRDEFARISANVSYTFDNGILLRSISGFQKGTLQETLDYDGTSTLNYTFRDFVHERIWSEEVNLVSPSTSRFTWLLGAYYQNDKYTFPVGTGYLLQQPAGVFDYSLDGTNPHTAVAGFGQIGYQLTDKLQATFGLRYSRSTSRNDILFHIPEYGIELQQHDFVADKKATGKVALNWTIDSNNFLYAFVATGSKAGGLNGTNLAGVIPAPFKAETVTDYEIGWKATLLNGHLRTQLGGYYNHYKNFQVTIVDPRTPTISSFYNVAHPTEIYGVEASAQGSFGHLGIDMAASLLHSSLGKFFAFDPRAPHTGTCDPVNGPATATGCVDLTGRKQTYAPKVTMNVGAQYEFVLNEDVSLTPRVDFSHISSAWGTLFEDQARGDYLVPRNILNAQLTLARGSWTIAGYGTNLTNQHYVASINGLRRLPGSPRQYGIRVSRTF